MKNSICFFKTVFFSFLLMLSSVWVSYGQNTPQEVLASAKAITIGAGVNSGLDNPIFHLTDSTDVRLVADRVQIMLNNLTSLNCEKCEQIPYVLGYCGVNVTIGDLPNEITVCAYNGSINLDRSPIDSRRFFLSDTNKEFERMVVKIGLRNNLMSQYGLPFKNVIPAQLQQPIIKCGIVAFTDLIDSCSVDFSCLDSVFTPLISGNPQPIFPDISIRNALEISSSRFARWISSPKGIAIISSEKNGLLASQQAIDNSISKDSILQSLIPLIDSAQEKMDQLSFQDRQLSSVDMHPYTFFIRTEEGGLTLLTPVGHSIGALDRIYYFWVYTDQETFNTQAILPTKVQDRFHRGQLNKLSVSTVDETVNLKGQIVKRTKDKSFARCANGLYLYSHGASKRN